MPTNSSSFLCLVRKFQIGRADNQSSCGFLHQQWLTNARINQQRPNQGIDTCLLIFLIINQNKSRQQTSFSFCLFINHHWKAFQDWSGCKCKAKLLEFQDLCSGLKHTVITPTSLQFISSVKSTRFRVNYGGINFEINWASDKLWYHHFPLSPRTVPLPHIFCNFRGNVNIQHEPVIPN